MRSSRERDIRSSNLGTIRSGQQVARDKMCNVRLDNIAGIASMNLRENHKRILTALKEAVDTLGMTDQLAIVGGVARHIAGEEKQPGDVDVLIEKPLCEKYWEFFKILTKHGLRS